MRSSALSSSANALSKERASMILSQSKASVNTFLIYFLFCSAFLSFLPIFSLILPRHFIFSLFNPGIIRYNRTVPTEDGLRRRPLLLCVQRRPCAPTYRRRRVYGDKPPAGQNREPGNRLRACGINPRKSNGERSVMFRAAVGRPDSGRNRKI